MAEVSIVIVNFNTRNLLKSCLDSIKKNSKKVSYEILVVDNGSRDGSQKMVEKGFPEVTLIKNKKNLGFAVANNQGIVKAGGEFILLLNSDTLLIEDVISKMVSWIKDHPQVGIATASLVYPDGSHQPTGGYSPTLVRLVAWMFFLDDLPFFDRISLPIHPHSSTFFTRSKFYLREQQLDWVTGAFMLVRRHVFDQIGFLDEDFFMYVEDVEFGYRAKKAGWEIVYLPQFRLVHFGGASSRRRSDKDRPAHFGGTRGASSAGIAKEYLEMKKFFVKHKPWWQLPPVRLLLKIGAAARFVIFGTLGITMSPKEARIAYAEAFRQV